MLSLKSFRKKVKGLADLLKYGFLYSENIMVNKDGSLTTMYYFRGDDTASSTPQELIHNATQLNAALQKLGDGWLMHVDAPRTSTSYYPDNNHFPNKVAQLIDEERREFFQGATCYSSKQYLSLTYLPSFLTDKVIASAAGTAQEQELEQAIIYFETSLQAFEDALVDIIALERLGAYTAVEEDIYGNTVEREYSSFLEILHYIITGIYQPIRQPACSMYLDAYLVTQNLTGGITPQIGDKYIATVSVDGLPGESYPAMLKGIEELPIELRFNTRFFFLDKTTAQKELTDYYKSWNQKVYSILGKLFPSRDRAPKMDKNSANMAADAEEALEELESDLVSFGYVSTTIVLMDDDLEKLNEKARAVRQVLQAEGFGCRIETINTLEAWLGSHPGNSFANLRKPLIHTLNLAHLLPLASVWDGNTINPNPLFPVGSPCLSVLLTDGETPFYFNPYVSDLGHTFIFGPTGSGKSTLLGLLAAQFQRYAKSQVYCFDKGNSMEVLCRGVKGKHIDIGKASADFSLAPLSRISESKEELIWATDWMESLIRLRSNNHGITPKQRSLLTESMKELSLQPEENRTLSHFYNIILAKDQEIALTLKHYTAQGNMGHLLDSRTDNLELSNFSVFEMETLMNMGDENVLPVLLYIFHRIEQSLKGQPTMLILDEAWLMLQHPVFKAKIREWLKVLRKQNCMVVMATQSLSDAQNSGILDVITESCPTKFYLPNYEALSNAVVQEIYTKQGLNEKEIYLIGSAKPKRHYYLRSSEGRRMLNLRLGRKTLAFIGASDKESVAKVRELAAVNPDGWVEEWLKIKAA